jgi:hypothetical protein
MSDDVFNARVLFDPDGEGLDFTDINDLQKRHHAQLVENFVASGVYDAIGVATAPATVLTDPEGGIQQVQLALPSISDLVWSPFPGQGFIRAAPIQNAVQIVAGPFAILTSATPWDGGGESVVMGRLTDMTVATAVGDATNPRIDLIEIVPAGPGGSWFDDTDSEMRHFEDAVTRAPTTQPTTKRRRAVYTIQAKQGTPAVAASLQLPTPTAGAAVLGAVYIPAAHNTWHADHDVRDMRFPLGNVIAYDVMGYQASILLSGGNPWAVNPGQHSVGAGASSGAGDPVTFFCPIGNKNARLVGIGVAGRIGGGGAGGTINLIRGEWSGGGYSYTSLADLSAAWNTTLGYKFLNATQLMDACAAIGVSSHTVGARVANRPIGTPMWCNGRSSGIGALGTAGGANQAPFQKLAIRVTGDFVSQIEFVRFFVAHGM